MAWTKGIFNRGQLEFWGQMLKLELGRIPNNVVRNAHVFSDSRRPVLNRKVGSILLVSDQTSSKLEFYEGV